MDDALPTVTVLIAARPGQTEVKAADAARCFGYPTEKLELIIARGKQPSAQRNAGIKAAKGEWIYFLDDDSVAPAENLKRALKYLNDPAVLMVGGPNLCPPEAPALEQVFALVLSSWLAFGPSRARYARVGQPRTTSEKELILCNLMARRQPLLDLGGFNEALYPNEENALMDELQKRGGKLIYDPDLHVLRRPRASFSSFCRMLITYGRGRAEQFRLHPTVNSVLNFVPPAFCLYLAVGFVLMILKPAWWWWTLAPLGFYTLVVFCQAAMLLNPGPAKSGEYVSFLVRALRALGAIPFIVLTHVLYGAGFWRGLFTKLKGPAERGAVPVSLERIDLASQAS